MLSYLEMFTLFTFVVTVITQVVVPLWNERPIFPMLRSRRKKLVKELREIHELSDEEKLAAQIQECANNLNKTKENQNG